MLHAEGDELLSGSIPTTLDRIVISLHRILVRTYSSAWSGRHIHNTCNFVRTRLLGLPLDAGHSHGGTVLTW